MWCNQVFSEINEGEVKNIIVCDNYEAANYLARCTYGDEAFAVDTTQYPLRIGDKYIDGRFFRLAVEEGGEEKEIFANPTEKQAIDELTIDNEMLVKSVMNLDYGLSLQTLGVTETEIALLKEG